VVDVIRDGWDNVFRNAAFHADYCLHGSHVRTLNPDRDYSGEQVPRLFNRAMAYFNCITALYKAGIERYEEPKVIPMPPYACQGRRDQTATVIVRQGHGVVGLMSWVATRDETFRALVGRFTPEESRLLDADQHLALLPARVARPGRD
jgi:hypothetical protein